MSKLSEFSSKSASTARVAEDAAVQNFIGGTSYKVNAIDTLKIIAASSIFGEPQYYKGGLATTSRYGGYEQHSAEAKYLIFGALTKKESAVDTFTHAIDAALDCNFKATLDLALELRTDYLMRLNPAVIFVRATMHKNRIAFNEANPGYMKEIGKKIAFRPDDLTNQFDYFMYVNKTKKGLTSLMKRTWAERLAEYSRYQLNKYKGKKLIDLVRLSHAWSNDLDELMKTGTIAVEESENTWETLRSAGKSWTEILDTIKVPHMALLRNLRGIFSEINDKQVVAKILEDLKAGVKTGKQFPFRYKSAYDAVKKESGTVNCSGLILDALEECIDIAVENMPKLKGKVISLCDNSGSAWGAFSSEYGNVTVAEIANLSALITAKSSDEGYIGVFGDKLDIRPVSQRNGILTQLDESNRIGKGIGHGTEHGIWLFWDKAIKEKEIWDTVFIYSDMQAGHGGLYGRPAAYKDYITRGSYIDVLKLVDVYRRTVNPKVNVFSVQVAGYDNTVLPENLYRGAVLAGWTGKESIFAAATIKIWDQIESKNK